MKRKLLFLVAFSIGGFSYGQCDITGVDATMCLTDAPVGLSVASPGAVFDGPGVVDGVFSPSNAGVGTHTITVEAPGEGYSVDEGIPFVTTPIAGTSVSLGDDAVSGDLPIGFDFEYFGEVYSNFRISSNGFMAFPPETDNGCCGGEVMPNASGSEPQNNIGICWDDLNPTLGGTISYQTVGTAPNRILIADWNEIRHYGSTNVITGQIKLFETTNCVEVHIVTQNDPGGTHTLGMQNAAGTEAYVAPGKNGTSWTATNYAIAFCPNEGCTGSTTVEVVPSPTVNVTSDVEEICIGEEVTLSVSGTADEYSFGPGIENGVPFAPTTAGMNVFVASGTDTDAGCIATGSVSVFVHETPYVEAGLDKVVCADEEFILEGISDDTAVTFVWDMGATNGVAMTQDPGTVTYTVTGTNAGGCQATGSVEVQSKEVPTGTGVVTMATGAAYDGMIDFTPSGGTGTYTFLWSNGATTEDISALTTGSYTVTVSDGECDSDVTFIVDSQAGVEDSELKNLTIYPNPFVESFAIEFEGKYAWSVFDNTGKLVSSGQGNGKELVSLEGMAAGTYIVKVIANEKEAKLTLVKE